jgi:hypothetical protein
MNQLVVGIRVLFAVLAIVAFIAHGLGVAEKPSLHYLGWGLAFLTLAFFLTVKLD